MHFLEVQSIYKNSSNNFTLQNIQLSLQRFQNVAIIGETGSGKSTLLKIIAGLEQADSGNVFFEGERVKGPFEKLIPGHKGIAYLSQYFELPNFLRVEQVLDYANLLSNEAANELYVLCDIVHLMKRRTDQLSGGEKQRIALAKLLLTAPKLLLLDEPFSNFDAIHKATLKSILAAVSAAFNITILLIAHEPLDILSWADFVFVMKDGEIIQENDARNLYQFPVNSYVAGLLGTYQLLPLSFSTLFTSSKKWHIVDDKIFVRPNDFYIATNSSNTNKAIIEKIIFYGSFSMVMLHISNASITLQVYTQIQNLQIGDEVFIEIS